MIIPIDKVEIAPEKITGYLLVKKQKNDKSAFLAKLGYTMENWNDLLEDIKKLVTDNNATLQNETQFGSFYQVKGKLRDFSVVTIWLQQNQKENFKFITLFPELSIK